MTIERTGDSFDFKAALNEAMVHVSGEVANRATNPDGVGTVACSTGGSVALPPVADDGADTALDRAADFYGLPSVFAARTSRV